MEPEVKKPEDEEQIPSWKRPKPPEPEPVTVELWNPINVFGRRVTHLVCREKLDGFGLRKLRGLSDEDKAIKVIEILYRTTEGEEIGFVGACSLKTEDIQRLGEACAPFAGSGLTM